MLLTTTPNIEGKKIIRYYGIITGEAIMGANIFKDLFAGITDIVGGRSGAYEQELKKAKQIALNEMITDAKKIGANAIISIDLDYETIGKGTMLRESISGTAAKIQKNKKKNQAKPSNSPP